MITLKLSCRRIIAIMSTLPVSEKFQLQLHDLLAELLLKVTIVH